MSIKKGGRYVVGYEFIAAANRLVAHVDEEGDEISPDIAVYLEIVRHGIAALDEEETGMAN